MTASQPTDWSQALDRIGELEKRLAALPQVFLAPAPGDAFRAPSRDPLRWKAPSAPALVVVPASAPVMLPPPDKALASPPVLLGIFHVQGKNRALIRDGDNVYTLSEGQSDPQLPYHLVSLTDGVRLQDAKGREIEIRDPQQEDERRLARVRDILEGRGPPTVYRISSPAALRPQSPHVPVSTANPVPPGR